MSIDEKALDAAIRHWENEQYIHFDRQRLQECIEIYEAAKAKEQPVGCTDEQLLHAIMDSYAEGRFKDDEAAIAEFKRHARTWKPKREVVAQPTEAMCDRARGFIMGLDLGIRTFEEMREHLENGGYPTLDFISNHPGGHITKWDVADCIWQLMASVDDVPVSEER